MKTLYHCTRRENLESILKKGLIPKKPDQVLFAALREKGVYLSKTPFEWMYWATDENKYAGAMIEVDVAGFELIKSNGITHDDKAIPEFIYLKQIPVERFVRINVSTDKHPCRFDEFKFRGQHENNY